MVYSEEENNHQNTLSPINISAVLRLASPTVLPTSRKYVPISRRKRPPPAGAQSSASRSRSRSSILFRLFAFLSLPPTRPLTHPTSSTCGPAAHLKKSLEKTFAFSRGDLCMVPRRQGCWAQQAKEQGGTGFPPRTAPFIVSPSPHKRGTNRGLHRCLQPYRTLRSPPLSFSCPSPRLCNRPGFISRPSDSRPGQRKGPALVARCKRRSSRQVPLSVGARALSPGEFAPRVPSARKSRRSLVRLLPPSFQPCLAVAAASKEESDSLKVTAGGCFLPRGSWPLAVFRKQLFSH